MSQLNSPYGQGPESLSSPVPNPAQAIPQVPKTNMNPAPKQVQPQAPGPQAPNPQAQQPDQDVSGLVDSLDDSPESALVDSLDMNLPNPIDAKFTGREVEGSILFGTTKLRQTKSGDVEVYGHNGSGEKNWHPITSEDRDWIRGMYKLKQDVTLGSIDAAVSVPMAIVSPPLKLGAQVATSLIKAGIAGATGAYASKKIREKPSDADEYLFRRAAGLTDQQVNESRSTILDFVTSAGGQLLGDAIGGLLQTKNAQEIQELKKLTDRAKAFRDVESTDKALKAMGINATPEQLIASTGASSNMVDEAKFLLSHPADSQEKSLILNRIKNTESQIEKSLDRMFEEQTGQSRYSDIPLSVETKTQTNSLGKDFLTTKLDQKKEAYNVIKNEVLNLAGNSQLIPPDRIMADMEKIIAEKIKIIPGAVSYDGKVNKEVLYNTLKKSNANSTASKTLMGDLNNFVSFLRNFENMTTRKVGQLADAHAPNMKDVFSKDIGGGMSSSQDVLSGLGSPPTYIGEGKAGTLPGSGGDINMMLERPGVGPETIGGSTPSELNYNGSKFAGNVQNLREDYLLGREQTLPGQTLANPESRMIQGDTRSTRLRGGQTPNSTSANITLKNLSDLLESAQELANFGSMDRTREMKAFGELSNSLREQFLNYGMALAKEKGQDRLAAKFFSEREWYAKSLPEIEVLQKDISNNTGNIASMLLSKDPVAAVDMIGKLSEVVGEKQMGEIRGQYLKNVFIDGILDARKGVKNPTAAVKGLFNGLNLKKTMALFGEEGTQKLEQVTRLAEGLADIKQSGANRFLDASDRAKARTLSRTLRVIYYKYGVPVDILKEHADNLLSVNPVVAEFVDRALDKAIIQNDAQIAIQKKQVSRTANNIDRARTYTQGVVRGAVTDYQNAPPMVFLNPPVPEESK